MKSKRNMRMNKRKGKTSKKGGYSFFKSSKPVYPSECDPNDLVNIKGSVRIHNKYKNCCPKSRFFGTKNRSPYCKQLELNFEHALREENYQADDEQDTVSRIADAKAKRRWFRGGKKTRKNRKSRK
jgi:hypothetical protein